MNRRAAVKSIAFVGAAATAIPQAALAEQEKFRWKLVSVFPPKLPIYQEAVERFAQRVETASGGRLKIKVFAAGELVPPLEVFDTVRQGTAELGVGTPAYWAGKSSAAQLLTGVPFGMNSQQTDAWFTEGGGMQLWEDLYAPFNLIPLRFGYSGSQMAGWYNKEIKTSADFNGLKVRMTGLGGKVLSEFGANVVLIPGSELYLSLERGVIDAAEWIGPFVDKRMGFDRIAKYYYSPCWHESTVTIELMINSAAWANLPADLREIIALAASETASWTLAVSDARNSSALRELRDNKRISIQTLPTAVLKDLKKKAFQLLDGMSAEDKQFKKIYSSYRRYQRQLLPWSEIGDEAAIRAVRLE